MATLVVGNVVEVIFSTEVLHDDGNLVNIGKEPVHSGTSREFSFLDEINGITDWFAVRENHYGMFGFSEQWILGFNSCC